MSHPRYGLNFLFGAIAWVNFAGLAHADVVPAWVAAARDENSEIQKGKAELNAALARVPQAKSLPDPAIEFEVMGENAFGAEQTVRLAQGFPWPGTLGQRESSASLQARAYWHEVQNLELAVASRIRAIAVEIAFLRKEASLVRENLELFKKQEDFLEQVSRGGGEVSDLVRVEMESGLLGDELAKIDEMVEREKAELEAIVGRPIPDSEINRVVMPSRSVPREKTESLAARLEATNPMLQALSSRVEAARAGVSLARLETYPEFMVSAGYRRVNEPGMGESSEWMNEAVVMFSISLPIWGEKNSGKRDEASAMLEAAVRERENSSRMLRSQLEILLSRGRDATRRAKLFHDQLLPKARQSHQTVEASYRADRANLLDVFESRRRLLETETGYWRAVADKYINRAEIEALFGTEIQNRKLTAEMKGHKKTQRGD